MRRARRRHAGAGNASSGSGTFAARSPAPRRRRRHRRQRRPTAPAPGPARRGGSRGRPTATGAPPQDGGWLSRAGGSRGEGPKRDLEPDSWRGDQHRGGAARSIGARSGSAAGMPSSAASRSIRRRRREPSSPVMPVASSVAPARPVAIVHWDPGGVRSASAPPRRGQDRPSRSGRSEGCPRGALDGAGPHRPRCAERGDQQRVGHGRRRRRREVDGVGSCGGWGGRLGRRARLPARRGRLLLRRRGIVQRGNGARVDDRPSRGGRYLQLPPGEDQVGVVEHVPAEVAALVGLPEDRPLGRVARRQRSASAQSVSPRATVTSGTTSRMRSAPRDRIDVGTT